jgi:hypothetical protein
MLKRNAKLQLSIISDTEDDGSESDDFLQGKINTVKLITAQINHNNMKYI